MTASYSLIRGRVPLLISMPHNGQHIPDDIAQYMTQDALAIRDTDWYLDKLYSFAKDLGAYILMPECSRYVIDLNRNPSGENLYPGANSTELCPTTAFDLAPLYQDGKAPDQQEINRRVSCYWQPYHDAIGTTLNEIKNEFGRAVLLEAHSILSHVPRFFDGRLPDFNFGTADGDSCSDELLKAVEAIDYTPYSQVSNGRFKGGYITRHFGDPDNDIHAIQLELSQITYMDEATLTYKPELAKNVMPKLALMVLALIKFAQREER